MAAEPTVPKKSRYRKKKKDTQKEKGVVIRESSPEVAKSPLVSAEDKGKEIVREPSPPTKRQKVTSIPGPRQEPLAPEAELKNIVNSYPSLDEVACSSGQSLET